MPKDPAPKDRRTVIQEHFGRAYEAHRAYKPAAGKWSSPLFMFTRTMRSPELWDCDPWEIANGLLLPMMECCGQSGHEHGSAGAVWRCHFANSDDPMMAFVSTWSAVQKSANGDPLTRAFEMAKREPYQLLRRGSAEYAHYIRIAAHLQRERPGQTIMLPCEKLAAILHCEKNTISRKAGLLTLMKEGRFTEKTAHEYTFHLERFDAERQEIPASAARTILPEYLRLASECASQ